MKLTPLNEYELVILSHATIRCLISNGILSKEDIMACQSALKIFQSSASKSFHLV